MVSYNREQFLSIKIKEAFRLLDCGIFSITYPGMIKTVIITSQVKALRKHGTVCSKCGIRGTHFIASKFENKEDAFLYLELVTSDRKVKIHSYSNKGHVNGIEILCNKCKKAKNKPDIIAIDNKKIRGKELDIEHITECIRYKVPFIYYDDVLGAGAKINIFGSDRLSTFLKDDFRCVECGLKATKCFAETYSDAPHTYHVNFYGYDGVDQEFLFTKDHILPKTYGGPDRTFNFVTMCEKCNATKSNKIPENLPKSLFNHLNVSKNFPINSNNRVKTNHDYAIKLKTFVDTQCVGKEYDSCINSPCPYSSGQGCTHPSHPKNIPKE